MAVLRQLGVAHGPGIGKHFVVTGFWIVVLWSIALACPNTLQLLGRHERALEWKADAGASLFLGRTIARRASLGWAVAVAILNLESPSEFLSWQF